MNYETYFDLSQTSMEWQRFWPGIVLVICTLIALATSINNRSRVIFTSALLVLEVAVLAFAVTSTFDQFQYYRQKYDSQEYSVIEGVVANHQPVTRGDGGMESFEVNGVTFVYLGKDSPPPFHQTVSQGGKIRNGLPVRITYTSRYGYVPRWAILKIEIAEQANSSTNLSQHR